MRLSTLALFGLVWPITPGVLGADLQSAWASECSRRIVSPIYPMEAVNARLAGSVSARFTVDSDGVASQLTTDGPTALAKAAESAIRQRVFPKPCDGRSIETKFSFTIEAESPQPVVSVCFEGELDIHVIANGIKMICSNYVNNVPLTGKDGLTLYSVCDILANPTFYAGRGIAVLGRLETTMEGVWLSEDNCGTRVETEGYVWPNILWLGGEGTAPDPPLGLLVLDRDTLSIKLAAVRRSTALKMQESLTYNSSDKKWGVRNVQQSWGVIYGRVEVQRKLRPQKGDALPREWGNGFGHLNAAPIQIVRKVDNSVYFRDDEPTVAGAQKSKP